LKDDVDLDTELFEHLQTLTPAQRLEDHERALELVRAIRRSDNDLDPRAVWLVRFLP
jgi:hypothetical protein